jgi:peptidoglycan/LPS O-acetylase OafA/YrhL
MKFRKDINGLRAVAVVSVVLFHFFPLLLPGGFVGVDIFFVISGYLMTSIILTGIQNDNFSTLNFYIARANRIVPALFFICLVLTVFGWFFLPPQDLKLLSKHVGGSISFLSNMIYLGESGYFDTASKSKWLLHTWSLSAEWQFYIIYPLFLILLTKYLTREKLKYVILILTFVGFIVNLIYSYLAPEFSYFSLVTRAWEMMIGSIAFLFPAKYGKAIQVKTVYVGLLLLLLSCLYLSEDIMWPGYYALVPTLGTFLILCANYQDNFLTANSFSQKMGRYSYSIYLWHWPIVVGFLYFELTGFLLLFGLVSSFVLGYLSYRYIEVIQFNRRFYKIYNLHKSIPLWLILIMGGISSSIFFTNGALWHYSTEIQSLNTQSSKHNYTEACFNENSFGCFFNAEGISDELGDNSPDLILIGDSHSFAILPRMVEMAALSGKSLMYFGSSACLPVPELVAQGYNIDNCNAKLNSFYEDFLKNHPTSNIIVSARFPIYFIGYNEGNYSNPMMDVRSTNNTVFSIDNIDKNSESLALAFKGHFCSLAEEHNVYVIKTGPEFGVNIPNEMTKALMSGNKENISLALSAHNIRNIFITKMLSELEDECAVTVLETNSYLCNDTVCPASADGKPLYKDDDHLNYEGAKLLSPIFTNILHNL